MKKNNFKKLFKGIACAIGILMVPMMLTGCGKNGADGENGKDGSTWLYGTITPTTEGKDGDFYVDTDDYLLYQKSNGEWSVLMRDFGKKGDSGESGEAGSAGITPHIGSNGNWYIGATDTGYKAVGEDGQSATIGITNDGYWEINGEKTEYLAEITESELVTRLSDVIEYSTDLGFNVKYESVENFWGASIWHHNYGTFKGWGGNIGQPTEIEYIMFKVKARDLGITKIKVLLFKNLTDEQLKNRSASPVFEKTLDVSISANETKDIIVPLDEKIINTDGDSYYFAYSCDNYCDHYGNVYGEAIPSDSKDYVVMSYFSGDNGGVNYTNIPTAINGSTYYYTYYPVLIGTYTPHFKLKQSAIDALNVLGATYKNKEIVLPSTILGFAGQTMEIYYDNILGYYKDDVCLKISGKGKQFSDRWTYTPTDAENFTLTIGVYTKDGQFITSKTVAVDIKNDTTTKSLNALVIGDSTVNAGTETQKMLDLAGADENVTLSLLGTRGSGTNKHEGRGGWTASAYVRSASDSTYQNPFYNPETSNFDFSYYMKQNYYDSESDSFTKLDVVFLQLGINDFFGQTTTEGVKTKAESFISDMQFMIDSIHTFDSNIKVIINLIIPPQLDQSKFTEAYGLSQTSWRAKLNSYDANREILSSFTESANLYLSWYNGAINCYDGIGNDVHPNDSGYASLGTQMYYFMRAIMSE